MKKFSATLFLILFAFAQPAFAEPAPACGDFKNAVGPIFMHGRMMCMCYMHYKQNLKPGEPGGPFLFNVHASAKNTCDIEACASAIALAKRECSK